MSRYVDNGCAYIDIHEKRNDEKSFRLKSVADTAQLLAEECFHPDEWDCPLIELAAPILARTMVDAALTQLKFMGVDTAKIGKSIQSFRIFHGNETTHFCLFEKSTAIDWLLKFFDDIMSGDLNALVQWLFASPVEGLPIRLTSQLPEWLKSAVLYLLYDSFHEEFWKNINKTTLNFIHTHIANGLTSGESVLQIAKKIEQDAKDSDYSRNRALNVTRTEAGNALNGARSAAIDNFKAEVKPTDTRLPVRKVWISVLGPTTRAAHADLDGVPENDDGMWELGGVMCRWPGDVVLPPNNRCNCQCTLIVEFGMDAEEADQLLADYADRVISRERKYYLRFTMSA